MINNADIRLVFEEHKTKSSIRQPDKNWQWSCSCGQNKILDTRDDCVVESQNHWASKILELMPTDEPEKAYESVGESAQDEAPSLPRDLGILSYLIREVDCERLTMPEARKAIGKWFHDQKRASITEPGRVRIRRLKQITDAMNEEFVTLLGSQS